MFLSDPTGPAFAQVACKVKLVGAGDGSENEGGGPPNGCGHCAWLPSNVDFRVAELRSLLKEKSLGPARKHPFPQTLLAKSQTLNETWTWTVVVVGPPFGL